MIGSNTQDVFGRIFTYIRDRGGPKIDLSGTPEAIHLKSFLLFSPI